METLGDWVVGGGEEEKSSGRSENLSPTLRGPGHNPTFCVNLLAVIYVHFILTYVSFSKNCIFE